MSFMEAVRSCFSRYVDFQGRSRRAEFWFFALFLLLVGVVFNVLISMVGASMMSFDPQTGQMTYGGGGGLAMILLGLYIVFVLGTFLPNLAVAIRRLHDGGRSGWWVLISLPLVGFIVLIVFFVIKTAKPAPTPGAPTPSRPAPRWPEPVVPRRRPATSPHHRGAIRDRAARPVCMRDQGLRRRARRGPAGAISS